MAKQQIKPSIQNVINRFNAYKAAAAACNLADKAWDNDPTSEELEAAFDVAHNKKIKAFNSLVGIVMGFTDDKIGRDGVQRIVGLSVDEFIELVESAA